MSWYIEKARAIVDATPRETRRIMNMQIAREQALFYAADVWRELLPIEQIALTGAVLALAMSPPSITGEK